MRLVRCVVWSWLWAEGLLVDSSLGCRCWVRSARGGGCQGRRGRLVRVVLLRWGGWAAPGRGQPAPWKSCVSQGRIPEQLALSSSQLLVSLVRSAVQPGGFLPPLLVLRLQLRAGAGCAGRSLEAAAGGVKGCRRRPWGPLVQPPLSVGPPRGVLRAESCWGWSACEVRGCTASPSPSSCWTTLGGKCFLTLSLDVRRDAHSPGFFCFVTACLSADRGAAECP